MRTVTSRSLSPCPIWSRQQGRTRTAAARPAARSARITEFIRPPTLELIVDSEGDGPGVPAHVRAHVDRADAALVVPPGDAPAEREDVERRPLGVEHQLEVADHRQVVLVAPRRLESAVPDPRVEIDPVA